MHYISSVINSPKHISKQRSELIQRRRLLRLVTIIIIITVNIISSSSSSFGVVDVVVSGISKTPATTVTAAATLYTHSATVTAGETEVSLRRGVSLMTVDHQLKKLSLRSWCETSVHPLLQHWTCSTVAGWSVDGSLSGEVKTKLLTPRKMWEGYLYIILGNGGGNGRKEGEVVAEGGRKGDFVFICCCFYIHETKISLGV